MVDLESFLVKARVCHGDKYDYTNTIYINSKDKVRIICPLHGEFLQSPCKHIRGQGCVSCNRNLVKLNIVEGILNTLQGSVISSYEVPEGNLTLHTRVSCICTCGETFYPQVRKLSKERKAGCTKCLKGLSKNTSEYWIPLFKEKWGGRYSYEKFESVGANKPCTITCRLHGDFTTTPSKHKLRSGCPSCANINAKFDNLTLAKRYKDSYSTDTCYLYLLKLETENTFKVGISKQPHERFLKLKKQIGNFNVLFTKRYNRYICILLENFCLDLVKKYIVGGRGYSEVFSLDEDYSIEYFINKLSEEERKILDI